MLLLHSLASLVLSMLAVSAIWPAWLDQDPPPPLPDALGVLLCYAILLALLTWSSRRSGLSLGARLGPRPDAASTRWAIAAGVALACVSLAFLYAVFLPLSHVWPRAAQQLLIESGTVFLHTAGEHLALANLVNLLALALLVPFVEELLFRGLLLPWWASRWGARRAAVASSLVFAVLHVEVLGGFVFGVVASIAFLRTRSLWLPILIHVSNNTLVWLMAAGEIAFHGESPGSLEEFQSAWWLGLAGAAVGGPLLVVLLRRLPPARSAA